MVQRDGQSQEKTINYYLNDNWPDISFFSETLTFQDIFRDLEKYLKILDSISGNYYYTIYYSASIKSFNNRNTKEKYAFCNLGIETDATNYYRNIPLFELSKDYLLQLLNSFYEDLSLKKKRLPQINCPVALSEESACFFIHEILGHTLEADSYKYFKSIIGDKGQIILEKIDVLENPFGIPSVNYGDFDDSGYNYSLKYIIKDGYLKSLISNRRVSEQNMDCKLYRMTNLHLKGKKVYSIAEYPAYLYIDYVHQAFINVENGYFSLFASLGKFFKNNKHIDSYANIKISGNIKDVLSSVKVLSETSTKYAGFCVKNGQSVIVGAQSPSLLIENVIIGSV